MTRIDTAAMTDIQRQLYAMRDEGYRAFQAKLIPHYPAAKIIGVRVSALRKIVRDLCGASGLRDEFLDSLPHSFHEENYLHALLLNNIKEESECFRRVGAFLPFIDNWQITDALRPVAFAQNKGRVLSLVRGWILSSDEYVCRFGLLMLMEHFLGKDFDEQILDVAAGTKAEGYYARMAQAWFFAEALARQWKSALKVIEDQRLCTWVHNKTIQKARESYKVAHDHKAYLETLKIGRLKSQETNRRNV